MVTIASAILDYYRDGDVDGVSITDACEWECLHKIISGRNIFYYFLDNSCILDQDGRVFTEHFTNN